MKKNNSIEDNIEAVLASADTIKTVNVSPFFKDQTMQVLFSNKEEEQAVISWFTPQVQFVMLVCIVVLNSIAFLKFQSANKTSEINEFADTYGLSVTTSITLK